MLKLNGKPSALRLPADMTVRRFLDKMGSDECFTHDHLARQLKLPDTTLRSAGKHLTSYTFAIGRTRYWGNPKAIQELRKQVAA